MFYVYQMNDGRWQVDAFTSAPRSAHRLAFACPGFDTKDEAEAARRDMVRLWSSADACARFQSELTPAGEQLVIPGCERVPPKTGKPAQLSLWG